MSGMDDLNAYYKHLQDRNRARSEFLPNLGRWIFGVVKFWYQLFGMLTLAVIFGALTPLIGPLLAFCVTLLCWSIYLNIRRFLRVYILGIETENGHTKESLAMLQRNRNRRENNRIARQNRMPTF